MVVCMSRIPNYCFEATCGDRVAISIEGRRRPVACRLKRSSKVETSCFIPWLRPGASGAIEVKLDDGRLLPLAQIIAMAQLTTRVAQRCGEPRCANPDHLVPQHAGTATEKRIQSQAGDAETLEAELEKVEEELAKLQAERQLLLAELGRPELAATEILQLKLRRIRNELLKPA